MDSKNKLLHVEDKTFKNRDFCEKPLPHNVFENCTFQNCNFSGCNFTDKVFIDCRFHACNLSLAILTNTSFRDIAFRDCKMLGLQFDSCNEFGLSFSFNGCTLENSTFYKIKIKGTEFRNCQLIDTDFGESDLSGAVFENCDLSGTVFDHTNLEKADFRTSMNYSIDPENNRLKKAMFSLDGIRGLLDKYDVKIE